MSARAARRLAWSACLASIAIFLAGQVLVVTAGSSSLLAILPFVTLYPLANVVFSIVGVLIVSRRPDNRIGWLTAAIGLSGNIWPFGFVLSGFREPNGVVVPAAQWVFWLASWEWLPAAALALGFLPLLFPDGRFLSSRWRALALGIAVMFAIGSVAFALSPDTGQQVPGYRNPLGIEAGKAILNAAAVASNLGGVLAVGAGAMAIVLRFRRASSEQREQLKWFTSAIALLAVVALPAILTQSFGQPNLFALAFPVAMLGVPASIAIAVLKYRLYDIDLVINKAVVFGAMAAFITAVYVAIVVGLGGLLGSGTRPNLALSILATAIVAVAFQPVRERVQRAANRLVYGKRATPYEVLSQFSHRVAGTYSSEDVLPRMARVLGEGTGASRADVWIRLGDGIAPAASWPSGDGPAPSRVAITGQLLPPVLGISRIVPVRHQGELLGALSINKRTGELLTPIEETLLADLAAQAGLVLQSVRLTAELQARLAEISQQAVELRASRQRIVATQDGERRRLERNIHDGAQQNLVALTVKLRLATTLAKRDPVRARVSVKALEAESDQALETLRALARGIYPPLLREQGLAAAVRAEAEKMPLSATIRADHVDRYPPEVEAAVYFVCLEALQNVTKHARASRVEINLRSHAHELSFEVTDDGTGFDDARDARGSGVRNMIDRIEGMGGRLVIRSEVSLGTTVGGTVPIGAMEAVS